MLACHTDCHLILDLRQGLALEWKSDLGILNPTNQLTSTFSEGNLITTHARLFSFVCMPSPNLF
jgi:hypothetical protein